MENNVDKQTAQVLFLIKEYSDQGDSCNIKFVDENQILNTNDYLEIASYLYSELTNLMINHIEDNSYGNIEIVNSIIKSVLSVRPTTTDIFRTLKYVCGNFNSRKDDVVKINIEYTKGPNASRNVKLNTTNCEDRHMFLLICLLLRDAFIIGRYTSIDNFMNTF